MLQVAQSSLKATKEWTRLDTKCERPRSMYLVNRTDRCFLLAACDKYKCRYCGPRKMRKVAARMDLLRGNWFFTFTPPPDRTQPTVENDAFMKDRIRTFVNWMRHQPWGRKLVQGWCRETANSAGEPFLHYHAVFRLRSMFLPFQKMQERAHALGLGTPDFERVWKRNGTARYLTKYLTKSLSDDLAEQKTRRFGLSPGHKLPRNPDWKPEKFFRPELPDTLVPVVRIITECGQRYAVPITSATPAVRGT